MFAFVAVLAKDLEVFHVFVLEVLICLVVDLQEIGFAAFVALTSVESECLSAFYGPLNGLHIGIVDSLACPSALSAIFPLISRNHSLTLPA